MTDDFATWGRCNIWHFQCEFLLILVEGFALDPRSAVTGEFEPVQMMFFQLYLPFSTKLKIDLWNINQGT